MMYFYCYTLAVMALSMSACLADVFTSVQHMQSLYHREARLLDELNSAIHYFQETLDLLVKRHAQLSEGRRMVGGGSAPEHPVDAFTLVRRLARDWPIAANLMAEVYQLPQDLVDEMKEGEVELESALRGMHRLQRVYRLDSDALADGFVGTARAQTRMKAVDCMEVARWLSTRHLFSLASTWTYTAYRRVFSEGDLTAAPDQVASHLYLLTKLAQCESAEDTRNIPYLLSTLKQFPQLTLDATSAELYKLAMTHDCTWYNASNAMETVDMNSNFHKAYNAMCYGPPKIVQGFCYYVNYGQKSLIIAPFKIEEINIEPPIILVHDVISDQEIWELKKVFPRVMVDCEVLHSTGSIPSTYRTCTRGWVKDDMTPVSSQLTRRIGQLANLDMAYSEIHQVASYGLGGEYKLHNDALINFELSPTDPAGQRIATVMLYLNDVAAGGYTVFPALGVAVAPVKGAAVLWFNMLPDGTHDDRTLHGGCPVLLGSKWVVNKWIREGGQEWIRHCPIDGKASRAYFYL